MSAPPTIQSQIEQIRGHLPSSVRLIAVSKYVSVHEIQEAYSAGVRDFGESRVQEAQDKIHALSHLKDITWHFIGHLQSNKASLAIQLFDWIHSVDSLKLAQRLNRLANQKSVYPKVCLQVKIRPDPHKYGWDLDAFHQDLAPLATLNQLKIKGLMVILPQGLSETEINQAFLDTHELAKSIRTHAISPLPLTELSMGMSQDYPQAVAAGATMIRLGRILFPSLSQS